MNSHCKLIPCEWCLPYPSEMMPKRIRVREIERICCSDFLLKMTQLKQHLGCVFFCYRIVVFDEDVHCRRKLSSVIWNVVVVSSEPSFCHDPVVSHLPHLWVVPSFLLFAVDGCHPYVIDCFFSLLLRCPCLSMREINVLPYLLYLWHRKRP